MRFLKLLCKWKFQLRWKTEPFPLEKKEITRKMDVQQCGYFKYKFPYGLLSFVLIILWKPIFPPVIVDQISQRDEIEMRRNCSSDQKEKPFRKKKPQIKQWINKVCVVRHRCCIPKAVISYEVYQRGWNVYSSVVAKFLLGELLSIFLNAFGSFCRRKKKGLPCAEALDCT